MTENVSKVVDKTEFKCLIELAEEDTEYEIMVVPETTARTVPKKSRIIEVPDMFSMTHS